MIFRTLHKKLNIEQQKNREWTQPILCHMSSSKTKQNHNDKSLLWYTVWLVTETKIVEEILEFEKKRLEFTFILDIEERQRQNMKMLLSVAIL